MVDRIELVSQVFWLCLVFWGFYMVLLYGVLPHVALGLKLRRKRVLKFSESLVLGSRGVLWSEVFCSAQGVEGVESVEVGVRRACTAKFLLKESKLLVAVLEIFTRGEFVVKHSNSIKYWGLEPDVNFYFNITERAHLYPWRV